MRVFISLAIFFSLSAFSCPDFAGEYNNCVNTIKKNPESFRVRISQKKMGKHTEYSWQVEKRTPHLILADGKERIKTLTGPDSKTQMTVKETSSCIGDQVISNSQTVYGKEITYDVQTLFKKNDLIILRNSNDSVRKQHRLY